MIFRRKKGFTLVEIMIVVAIIGLLAAIAIPNFVKARDTAQKNACIANLKQIQGATQVWAIDANKSGSDTVLMNDLVPNYIKKTPTCPKGGTYSLTNVDTSPTCSLTADGHTL
ncbi:MAG: prepilin-type N-terminal cleavage/methylation domain-containing protein [Candidatus Omnitrophica bacterium]|nr:prepilin-type N-terminal cleavage/methylation domain-containing protein [Candidatus Omnitrophota bacterium]